jgi:hypothetical protein
MPLRVVQAVACKLSLKYHTVIEIINNQGEFINRPSQIFFNGKLWDGHFDIKLVEKHNSLQRGWKQNSHEELGK